MVSIPGSIGTAEGLFDYLADLQHKSSLEQVDPQSSQKKRKIDPIHEMDRSSNSGQVVFPISFAHVDKPTLEYMISKLEDVSSRDSSQDLVIEWNYVRISDTILASMRVYSRAGHHLILENECALMNEDFDEYATEKIEAYVQLFVAIVFAAHNSLLNVSNLKLRPPPLRDDADRSLNLELDLNINVEIAKMKNAIPLISAISRMVHSKKIVVDGGGPPPSKKRKFGTTHPLASSSTAPITPPTSTINTPSFSGGSPSLSDAYYSFPTPTVPIDTSLEGFYVNLQPPVSDRYLDQYESPKMAATLTPFQSQNVVWMINREGHTATEEGNIIKNPQLNQQLPLLYSGYHESEITGRYVNLFTDVATANRADIEQLTKRSFKGGILADEMGLGKTVSVLGLISKHVWNAQDDSHPNPDNFHNLTFSKGTLIIAPGSIMSQWTSEAKRHAPALRVYEYNGAAKDSITAEQLAKYDLVLVYYETFKSELSHSTPPPDRPRRKAVKYGFKMSPLVQILWFRCILDEAQMVETTTTKAASMAKLIPRWYSWAVTGTPLKSDYNDLFGLYSFLELDNSVSNTVRNFQKFTSDFQHKGLFFEFTKTTMRRNMKSLLTGQIHIPRQSRHVVHVPFSTIEQHYYEDLWRDCRTKLRLEWMDSINWKLPADASEAVQDRYQNSKSKMRAWLLALRQNCIHPSIIANAALRLGNQASNILGASRKIQSLTDVLDDMAKEARDNYDNNQHAYFVLRLKHGGMFEVLQEWDNAIAIYTDTIPKVEALVKFHAEEVQIMQSNNKRASDAEEEEENKNRLSVLVNNYHRWNLLLHQFYFYLAGIYHTINSEDLEVLYYKKAADIRRFLLEKQTLKVETSVQELHKAGEHVIPSEKYEVGEREFDEDLLKYKAYYDDRGQVEYGFRRERDGDMNMITNLKQTGVILDRQYAKILYLRKKSLELLTKKLIDNDDQEDATGEEYDNSLSEQEMVQVYISAYEALLQDRKFIIKGVVASLAEMVDSDENGEYVSDKAKEVETIEKNFRMALKEPGFKIECLKDLEFFLRTLKNSMMRKHESKPEYKILAENHEWLKSQMLIQSKLIDDLDLDVRKLNQLFNSRIAYYKSLQIISDTLLEWKHNNPKTEIKRLLTGEEKLEEVIANNRSRDLYFKALAEEQKKIDGRGEEIQKDCLICQEPIEKGMITYCGHTSCVECGLHWFKESRRCHTCNSQVKPSEWYNVSYKKMEILDRDADRNCDDDEDASSSNGESSAGANDSSVNNATGNQATLNKLITRINTQTIIEGQGAKLDSIIRHIKYIKNSTNGKCVVFSQWSRALDMLKNGLNENQIKFIGLSAGANKACVAKFQEDPSINVILLHARSHSSGLTLVCAQTVFIVEPVFNESLEKQAINRIHRIGQTKETSVFWYIIQDTIEERIQAIHNRKRDRKSIASVVEVDDKLELSNLADGGGEMVDDDDLRRCFTADEAFALR